jgi:hypothetical protein
VLGDERHWHPAPEVRAVQHQPMAGLQLPAKPAEVDFIELQRELQLLIETRAIREGRKVTRQAAPAISVGELLGRVRYNEEAIRMEFAEILDQCPWKDWKANYALGRNDALSGQPELMLELKFELIDVLFFWLNLALALGMSWDEVRRIYMAKWHENVRRQREGY